MTKSKCWTYSLEDLFNILLAFQIGTKRAHLLDGLSLFLYYLGKLDCISASLLGQEILTSFKFIEFIRDSITILLKYDLND